MRKWLPKAPQWMPGVWGGLRNMLPTRSGSYYPGSTFITNISGPPATPGTTRRAWCALLPDDTVRGYIGTTTKLYVGTSALFPITDVSKGGGYTSAADWSFAQYGNITFATDRVDAVQTRDASGVGNFADATGSPPKARIVCTQADQVLLFDLNDGSEKPDAFCACAPGDHTDWSGAGATTPTRIRHRPGKITAAIPFRDYVLVFKQSSVYKLIYTGVSPFRWRVELIAIGRGCFGKHDVVNCGDIVVFHGSGGAWTFDGASFRSITDNFGEICGGETAIASLFSPLSHNVFFFCGSTTDPVHAFAYNIVSDRWGAASHYMNDGGTALTSAWVPMTGEPAALRAMDFWPQETPDAYLLLNLSADPYGVVGTYWGVLLGAGGSPVSYIYGGIEGLGGRTMTEFSGLDVDYSSFLHNGSGPIPGDTDLRLDIYIGNSKDTYNLWPDGSGVTAAQADIASSTAQKRFDFTQGSVYARFKIKFPFDSGTCEVNDYAPRMGESGEL